LVSVLKHKAGIPARYPPDFSPRRNNASLFVCHAIVTQETRTALRLYDGANADYRIDCLRRSAQTSVLLTGDKPDYAQLHSVLHHVLQAIPVFKMTQRDSLQPNAFETAAHEHLALKQLHVKEGGQWVENRPGLHFVFPLAGPGIYVSGKLAQLLSPGDVLIVNGLSQGRICARDGQPFVFRTFSLLVEQLFPLLAGGEISLVQPLTRRLNTYSHYPASSPLAVDCHRLISRVSDHIDLNHRGQVLRITTAVLDHEFQALRRKSARRKPEDKRSLAISRFFQTRSVEDLLTLSVDELCSRFGCGRRQLSRLFHQHFSVSLSTLKMEMRLLKAVSLLRNPEAKIANVAAECGFKHLGLFNTCFRKRFGSSPTQWRKNFGPGARPGEG
jgi:AraC-like DNA-binding protein